jgi:hypothetical protein
MVCQNQAIRPGRQVVRLEARCEEDGDQQAGYRPHQGHQQLVAGAPRPLADLGGTAEDKRVMSRTGTPRAREAKLWVSSCATTKAKKSGTVTIPIAQ